MLYPYSALVHTITADNVLVFAHHKPIATVLGTDIYFADPYASWQPDANQNAIGLFRQYVPKGTYLRNATDDYIERAQNILNLIPSKCLGLKQPERLFNEPLQRAIIGCYS